ncbi:hint-domain-containing protein [Xylaria grammica]|nr:hint-domain-containing protein [Xylaria grammica]
MKTVPSEYHHAADSQSGRSTPTLEPNDELIATIHPLETKNGVLVTVQPPVGPSGPAPHVPCDIVLVIDVSSSMSADAPALVNNGQGDAIKEHLGLTVLDLTKHAARTILSTLNDGDRLGIVTFGSESKVVQELTPMTRASKVLANKRIDSIQENGSTNLWAGINEGLAMFGDRHPSGRVPALMVLTDGQPNYMCPPQGYVPKLRSKGPLPAIINTFGFGYEIRSGLLKAIADTCNGNYAFIPDAGMIGTVFVHAVAHLQSTYATQCTLEISAPEGVLLKSTTGKSVVEYVVGNKGPVGKRNLTIELGNLQYGQSRDIYLESVNGLGEQTTFNPTAGKTRMLAKLTYSLTEYPLYGTFVEQDILQPSTLPRSTIAYHQGRSRICELLSAFFPILERNLEYKDKCPEDMEPFRAELRAVIDTIPAKGYKDQHNVSLMEDLKGQIAEALSKEDYFERWGRHYFFSLWNAHAKQLCNSFKDPGPLMYNENPFFRRCRDALDEAFDKIPPPEPSSKHRAERALTAYTMASFNSQFNPCFGAMSPVLLATGNEVPVSMLRKGMSVQTPAGPRRVQALLKTQPRHDIAMCRVEKLLVTPWHPIKIGESEQGGWVFPVDTAEPTVGRLGPLYSVLLEPDGDTDAHAIRIGGVWGVTLGHGIVRGSDVRAHQFLGDYHAVSRELEALGSDEGGVYCGAGVRRDDRTGLVCGFEPLPYLNVDEMGSTSRLELNRGLPAEICV